MRNQGPLKSSCNAGELSPDLDQKLGLKQYYSGARRMKNLEPVPQAGCRLAPGTDYVDLARSDACRMFCLKVNATLSYILVLTDGYIDIYNANGRTKVFSFSTARITTERLAQYEFYGEANTVGIFHEDDDAGIRLFRTNNTTWSIDDWPYESKPKVDLGGSYSKTADRWEIYLRYTGDTDRLVVSVTAEGETTDAVSFVDATSGDAISPVGSTDADWNTFAGNIQTALRALPSLSSGVTCTYLASATATFYRVLRVTFGGDLAGSEYEFDCSVVNTADASALVAHTVKGETDFEELISATRGGFAGMTLYQDRAVYFGARPEKASIAMSDVGEYFRLDISRTGDQYARLERLRTETSQQIYHVTEDTYLLIFTDQGEWFVNNRTIKQSEPLNFVLASEIGTKKGVKPQKFDGRTVFISRDGSSLYSIKYDAVGESFVPTQEDLLATHLVSGIKRQWVQRKISDSTTPRDWLLREDGRLILAVSIKDQDIAAFSEWVAAGDGFICDIQPDGQDRVWLVVKRGGTLSLEIMEEAASNLFHCAINVTTDLAGVASGLSIFDGKQVWARIDGYLDGPYTVASGQILTDYYGKAAQIGLWQPPVYESMPQYRLLGNDEVLLRPARIHTVSLNLIDTESIALGANGRPAKNIDLARASDDLTVSPAPYTGPLEVAGLIGVADGPTVVVTQTRPGQLRLRDYTPGVKF